MQSESQMPKSILGSGMWGQLLARFGSPSAFVEAQIECMGDPGLLEALINEVSSWEELIGKP